MLLAIPCAPGSEFRARVCFATLLLSSGVGNYIVAQIMVTHIGYMYTVLQHSLFCFAMCCMISCKLTT